VRHILYVSFVFAQSNEPKSVIARDDVHFKLAVHWLDSFDLIYWLSRNTKRLWWWFLL